MNGDHTQDPEPDQDQTDEYPTTAGTLTPPAAVVGEPLLDTDDAGEEWVVRTTRGIRLRTPIAAVLALVLIAAGFWGGAELEKNHRGGSTSAAAGLAARFRSAAGTSTTGTTATSGFGFGGGSSSAATGTISVVDGDTLYVLSATGSLVKVTLTKTTTITRNADTTAVGLRPGDTIVVQGTTSANGNVAATSLTATAAGVSSTATGFGGGAPTGAPAATSATTTSPGG